MSTTIDQIRCYFASMKECADRALKEFAGGFAANPVHALRWSESAIMAAAKLELASSHLRWIDRAEKPATTEQLVGELLAETVRRARMPESSTSAIANLVGQCQQVAVAEAYEAVARIAAKEAR